MKRKSRTKLSLPHLQLSLLKGGLARKLCFHIFHFEVLGEHSHKSFVSTSSTFTFGGRGLARKLRSHIFHCHFLREVSHESFVFDIFHCRFLREISHESFVFYIFNFHFLRDVSHESFVFASSTVAF